MIHYLHLTDRDTCYFKSDDSPLVRAKYHKTFLKLTLNSFRCIYQACNNLLRCVFTFQMYRSIRQTFTGGRKMATYL